MGGLVIPDIRLKTRLFYRVFVIIFECTYK